MAGLFSNRFNSGGNTNAPASSAPSLFSGLGGATSGATTGSSLFGGLGGGAGPSTGTSSAGGLFGSTPATTTTTGGGSGGGLFGGAQPSPAATTTTGASLFGNTTNTSTAAQQAAATTQTSGAGLFGAAAPKPFQPASSLFASTTNAPQAAAAPNDTGSLFGANILPAQQERSGALAPANGAAPQPSYFQALLDKGNKRMAEEGGALPQLQYGLQDIQRKVRKVGQQHGPSSAGMVANAMRSQYILSASGVNVGQSLRDIEDLMETTTAAAAATAPGASVFAPVDDYAGVKDFLGEHHRSNFQKMIDSRLEEARLDFDRMVEEQLHMQPLDWQRFRRRIDAHLGLRRPDEEDEGAAPDMGSFGRSRRSRIAGGSQFGLPGATRSVIGAPGPNGTRQSAFGDVAEKLSADGLRPAPEDRTQRLKQDRFIGKVKDLNVARIQEKVYPIMTRFADIEAEPSNDETSMLVNAYQALVSITGEDATKENVSDPGAVRERQYARAYLDDHPRSRAAVQIRERIIAGSRRYLEHLFYTQLKSTVAKAPREANIGGVPTSIAEVKGYVRVRAARKELGPDVELLQQVNDDYCWVVLFYLLRSGLLAEAARYVSENGAAFKQIDRKFISYLRAYTSSPDHRLPPELQRSILDDYRRQVTVAAEDSIDPYRTICYKILGRCDLTHRSLDGITNDMMDWLWLQFALAREYDRVAEMQSEAFGLEELRASVGEIGARYFGPGSEIANAPTTLFFMQILAGMFEKAVAGLYVHNYVSAVHFAVALDFYGLLRVSGDLGQEDLLSETTRGQPQIAFGQLLGLYTRDFRTANAAAAVDYLVLICLNTDLDGDLGKKQRDLCYQALIEVTLETREFASLLGDVREDGQRIPGTIEQRLKLVGLGNERDFMRHVTLVAARTAEEQGRVADAALLFHLAEDYDKVIAVVNEALSVHLTTEIGEQPARLTPLKPSDPGPTAGARMSSLSLTAIDDPVELAVSMRGLYSGNSLYVSKIRDESGEILNRLITLAEARRAFENGAWPEVVDVSSPFLLLLLPLLLLLLLPPPLSRIIMPGHAEANQRNPAGDRHLRPPSHLRLRRLTVHPFARPSFRRFPSGAGAHRRPRPALGHCFVPE